jgi:transcriptional regulator with XRE-family HTH domain
MLPIMSWDQLATAVRARRTELGLTQVDVAAAGHVSVDMIRNIEHRRRTPKRVNPRTARAIEDALEWEPGSVTRHTRVPPTPEAGAPGVGDRSRPATFSPAARCR